MSSLKIICFGWLIAWARITAQPDLQLTCEIFEELVEINTTHSTGNTTQAAEAMAARLRAVGFEEKDIFIGGADPKKGNLVARTNLNAYPS